MCQEVTAVDTYKCSLIFPISLGSGMPLEVHTQKLFLMNSWLLKDLTRWIPMLCRPLTHIDSTKRADGKAALQQSIFVANLIVNVFNYLKKAMGDKHFESDEGIEKKVLRFLSGLPSYTKMFEKHLHTLYIMKQFNQRSEIPLL